MKRNDPEKMYTYPGYPEEQIELAGQGQQQDQQREVAIGRGINQFFETRRFGVALALHEAHDHGEGDDHAEHGADSERKYGRRRIAPSQAEADAGENSDVHELITHQVEPFAQARFFIKDARKIAIHAIDDGGKLQEKRARDKISAGEKPPRQNADKRRYDRNLVGRK